MLDELNAPHVVGFAGHLRQGAEATKVSGSLHRAAAFGAAYATKAAVEATIGTWHATVNLGGARGRR